MKKTNENVYNNDPFMEYECNQIYFSNGNSGNIITDHKKKINKVYIKHYQWEKVNIYLGIYKDYMVAYKVLLTRLMCWNACPEEKCFCAKD